MHAGAPMILLIHGSQKMHQKSSLWNPASHSCIYNLPPYAHTESKDLPHSRTRSQSSAKAGGDWLTAAGTTADTQYLHATSCSWTNGTTVAGSAKAHSIKPRTPLWGPQIPVCPSFPLLRDQIPSRGLSGPAVQSRQSQGCCPDAIRHSHSHSSQGWITL